MSEKDLNELARQLPPVDSLIHRPDVLALIEQHGRAPVLEAVRDAVGALRRRILDGAAVEPGECEAGAVVREAAGHLARTARPHLRRVINATGIILHTGLGRSAMPEAARQVLHDAAGYCNVQMDLHTGERVEREMMLKDLVRRLTGAEDLALVNNNAAATLLVLAALARGKEVIVSRGELIEIGGSFRLPDIMRESGALLHEVGATNKTHLRDYEKAIGPITGLLLKVNKSNYHISGFTAEVGVRELVELGRRHGIPVADDLGSGALVNLEQFGLPHEPTVQESLQAGADLVFFSTDKLIGGPQGALILGRAELISGIRTHPLYRAFRVDKMTVASLEAALRLFLAPEQLAKQHPVFQMLARPPLGLQAQAEELMERLKKAKPGWEFAVCEDTAHPGGGSLPATVLQTFCLRMAPPSRSAEALARRLRQSDPPVIARIRDQAVLLDMRTVLPGEVEDIVQAVSRLEE